MYCNILMSILMQFWVQSACSKPVHLVSFVWDQDGILKGLLDQPGKNILNDHDTLKLTSCNLTHITLPIWKFYLFVHRNWSCIGQNSMSLYARLTFQWNFWGRHKKSGLMSHFILSNSRSEVQSLIDALVRLLYFVYWIRLEIDFTCLKFCSKSGSACSRSLFFPWIFQTIVQQQVSVSYLHNVTNAGEIYGLYIFWMYAWAKKSQ